ncbi:MAG: hypothetical protein JZU63_05540 [Rhodoferax sp.]|nr:hypothetical protein [Rhodoferax sp.]
MPEGLITVTGITLADGTTMPIRKACDYGWIIPERVPAGWDVGADEACIGENLFLDQGRQLLAYAFGFRAPIENYTCQKFGVGTGVTTARVTDVALEAPVALASVSGATTAPITSVDYLTAFVMRVGFTVAIGDANGYLLTELGLFSGNNTLLARKIRSVGINKTSDFAPTLTWRIRF